MTKPSLNKDTQLCISIAARPSNIGTRFHNYLYEQLGLDFIYKAFTTEDIVAAISGVRALGIRGCAISMPFKEDVIPLLDEMDATASAIDSVNTIVNTEGHLKGYNTDYSAVRDLISKHQLNPDSSVLIRGSGGMAKAVGAAFRDAGFKNGKVIARNTVSGPKLADELSYEFVNDEATADIVVNVTPIGMAGSPDESALSFTADQIAFAIVVFDVVAYPAETPLIKAARAAGKSVISGAEVIALQAAKQFELYTGVSLTPEQVAEASAFSRS